MNQEMLDEFYAKASVGSGIRYSRVLTEDEQMRYEALNKAYEEEGVFPQGSVTYLKDYKDYTGKGIGLYANRSTLFLPENKLSDEELLQIIDLEHKISYSIEKINEDVNSGVKTDYPDSMQITPSESDNGVIAYEGKVDVWRTTAGEKYLYLAGTNVIEKMPIGSSTSEPFYTLNYEDDMVVYAMEEDTQQGLYAIALYHDGSNYTKGKLLHIDAQGTLLYEKDWNKKKVIPEDVETDSQGRVYVQTFLDDIYVYDQDGVELLKWEIPYDIEATDSMCQAKDGRVVFAKAFDYDGKPVPESVRFCYVEI